MSKITRFSYKPDDPIFSEGVTISYHQRWTPQPTPTTPTDPKQGSTDTKPEPESKK